MRRKLLTIILVLSAHGLIYGQWAFTQAGSQNDETFGVTGDSQGNTYTTGYFGGVNANVNGLNVNGIQLSDVFVSKIGPNGNAIWSKSGFGGGTNQGLDVAVDGSGNVYICGFFNQVLSFTSGVEVTSSGGQDAFVAKFDSNGNILWARSGGSATGQDRANAIAVDNAGNVFITGAFSGDASFGSLSLSSLNGTVDAFIIKYNTDGDEEWAKQGSGEEVDFGRAIVCDNSGNVYASGSFDFDISFDNFYPNDDIQNAIFLIKYSGSGNEEWFRFAGDGSAPSIGYDITSDGNSIYLTGDFGSGITFFDTNGGTNNINSSFPNSIFIAHFSSSGSYSWGVSEGSESQVTSRGISVDGGSIAIGGWFQCTFQSYSDEYGESTFNSIGFEDLFIARYSTNGSFNWARNFGSQITEKLYDIELHPSGKEVAVGSFEDHLVIPLGGANIDGLEIVDKGPNGSDPYCNDPNYSKFGKFSGTASLDGFTLDVIDPNRSPYDYFMRFGSGCDLSYPETCIDYSNSIYDGECSDELISCSPYFVSFDNQVARPFEWEIDDPWCVGYNYSVQWVPSETGDFLVTTEGDITATITSADGCYTNTATRTVLVHPDPSPPLISDDQGVNDNSAGPLPLTICPGESVQISAEYNDGLNFYWSGFNVEDSEQFNNPLTINESGFYVANVENEFGCISSTIIQLEVEDVPPIVDPFLDFENDGDTLVLCGNAYADVVAIDAITNELVQSNGFEWDWDMTPSTGITGESTASFAVDTAGWYVITASFVTEDNPCIDEPIEYTITDSIYVEVLPVPEAFIEAEWPEFVCQGDSVAVHLSYLGELEYVIPDDQDITILSESDSLFILSGEGTMTFSATISNEFGCSNTAGVSVDITFVEVPSILADPSDAVICPGDSVLLITDALGDLNWQGPGEFPSDSAIYVTEPGQYFLEVFYYAGCALVSNTIEIEEYSTPFLIGSNAVICEGDSVEISVNSSSSIELTWLDPLSGSDSTQVITEPGIYYAEISACGITVLDSIQVDLNSTELIISQDSIADYCEGDSILMVANYPFETILWNPDGAEGQEVYFTESTSVQAFAIDTNNCSISSNILDIFFNEVPPAPDFIFDIVCEGDDQLVSIESIYNIQFTDADGNTLVNGNQVLLENFFSDTTLYAIQSTEFCVGPMDSITIAPYVYPELPILASDGPVCTGDNLTLTVLNDDGFSEYVWIGPNGSEIDGAEVSFSIGELEDAGPYLCFGDNQGCLGDTASISVTVFKTLEVSLPPDTAMCLGNGYIIFPNGEFESYFWQDGSTEPSYEPEESGSYSVQVTDLNGCESADIMEISFVDCNISIPNVFTPNGDGINDEWIIEIDQPLFIEIVVFNRWGRKVFESNDEEIFWDGVHYKTNQNCSEGTYFYILKARTFDGAFLEDTGNIQLIRQ